MNEYASCCTNAPVKDAARNRVQWFLHGLFGVTQAQLVRPITSCCLRQSDGKTVASSSRPRLEYR